MADEARSLPSKAEAVPAPLWGGRWEVWHETTEGWFRLSRRRWTKAGAFREGRRLCSWLAGRGYRTNVRVQHVTDPQPGAEVPGHGR